MVVAAPAGLSVMRLWIEAGGELQTTLLLVSHVGPLNLSAALFGTATQLVTVVMVALFTAGGVLHAAMQAAPPDSPLRSRPPLAVRLRELTPRWFMLGVFVLAALTWKIFHLPLLLPALAAMFQRTPFALHERRWVGVPLALLLLAGYAWLVGDAVRYAWGNGEKIIAVLLVVPPLVAFLVTGPTPQPFARAFAMISTLAIVVLAVLVVRVSVQTPVLPLVAFEVKASDRPEVVQGHIIEMNDNFLIVLEKGKGVRYIPSKEVGEKVVLCGTPEEVTFQTQIRTFPVEDSLLSATGRQFRPRATIDPLCRVDVSESE